MPCWAVCYSSYMAAWCLNYQPMPWRTAVATFLAMGNTHKEAGASIDWSSNVLLGPHQLTPPPPASCRARQSLGRVWVRGLILLGIGLVSSRVGLPSSSFRHAMFPSTISRPRSWAPSPAWWPSSLGRTGIHWLEGWWQREQSADRDPYPQTLSGGVHRVLTPTLGLTISGRGSTTSGPRGAS